VGVDLPPAGLAHLVQRGVGGDAQERVVILLLLLLCLLLLRGLGLGPGPALGLLLLALALAAVGGVADGAARRAAAEGQALGLAPAAALQALLAEER